MGAAQLVFTSSAEEADRTYVQFVSFCNDTVLLRPCREVHLLLSSVRVLDGVSSRGYTREKSLRDSIDDAEPIGFERSAELFLVQLRSQSVRFWKSSVSGDSQVTC